MISASLAQIGEFSFILAELGVGLKLLPEQGRDLILAGAILSILLNPLMFLVVDWMKPWLEKRAGKTATPEEAKPIGPATEPGQVASVQATSGKEDGPPPRTALAGHSILIGYGRVGSLVGAALKEAALPFLVIEDADKTLAKLRDDGVETVAGNAANADVFAAANPEGAKRLILAIPNAFEAGQVVLRARAANPEINVIARAHSDAEVEHLKGLGADAVIMGEREIARGIVEVVTGKNTGPSGPAMGVDPQPA
jgi:CPA2 family monovalent cation:H+ antiporter-2